MTIRVNYPNWIEAIRAIATEWGAAFNGSNRMTHGVDAIDDLIVDSITTGIVLKSVNGHYWRSTISNAGVLTWTDLGITKP